MTTKRRHVSVPRTAVRLDDERARRARMALDKIRNKLIDRRGVVDARMELVYQALKEWNEPLTRAQIMELLGWGETEMSSGDQSPLNRLVMEGKVGIVMGKDNRRTKRFYPDPDLTPTLIRH